MTGIHPFTFVLILRFSPVKLDIHNITIICLIWEHDIIFIGKKRRNESKGKMSSFVCSEDE